MTQASFESVPAYIAAQPAPVQKVLRQIRGAIRKAVPRAEESISYQMPTYKLPGGPVLYFAGWKQHCSLYPATAGVLAAFEKELAAYEVNKGTIRLPLEKVPVKLIARIAKFRAKEVARKIVTRR
jgi:uncharacterized protein YdhG (YjbR/CyaY superfamily)